AARRTAFEPIVRAAVDLDQLAEPRATFPQPKHPPGPARLRLPQAEVDLHLTQRLRRDPRSPPAPTASPPPASGQNPRICPARDRRSGLAVPRSDGCAIGAPVSVKGFGRRPLRDSRARCGAGVRKPATKIE